MIELHPRVAMHLLEELVFENVRRYVNHCELLDFESELDDTIHRVLESLDDDGRDDPPSRLITAHLVDRAWARLAEDWRACRERCHDDGVLSELDRRVRDELRREAQP